MNLNWSTSEIDHSIKIMCDFVIVNSTKLKIIHQSSALVQREACDESIISFYSLLFFGVCDPSWGWWETCTQLLYKHYIWGKKGMKIIHDVRFVCVVFRVISGNWKHSGFILYFFFFLVYVLKMYIYIFRIKQWILMTL